MIDSQSLNFGLWRSSTRAYRDRNQWCLKFTFCKLITTWTIFLVPIECILVMCILLLPVHHSDTQYMYIYVVMSNASHLISVLVTWHRDVQVAWQYGAPDNVWLSDGEVAGHWEGCGVSGSGRQPEDTVNTKSLSKNLRVWESQCDSLTSKTNPTLP